MWACKGLVPVNILYSWLFSQKSMIDFKNPLLKCYMCTVCLSSHRLQYASGYKPGIEKKKKEKEKRKSQRLHSARSP